jgi:hypothetical protein
MSERVLRMIPTDQDYVPSAEQQAKAVALFRENGALGRNRGNGLEEMSSSTRANDCDAALCSFCGNRVALIPLAVPIPPRTDIVTAPPSSCGRSRRL